MSDPRLTAERLRTWVAGQAERERLCIGMMWLDETYDIVRPRLPEGGPDEARDIEAIHRQTRRPVWGAVGFRNNVCDSAADRTYIKKKFATDLENATRVNNGLWGFVFFTNVNLTPGEISKLEAQAKDKGVRHIRIFHRELIRSILDDTRGMALRFNYLDIPLTEEEQKSFFNQHGERMEGLIKARFGSVDERLRRLEFLSELDRPLRSIRVTIYLDKEYPPGDLGPCGYLVEFDDPVPLRTKRSLYVGEIGTSHSTGPHGCLMNRGAMWYSDPDGVFEEACILCVQHENPTSQLYCELAVRDHGPFRTLGSLLDKHLSVYATRGLLPRIESIAIQANDWKLIHVHADYLRASYRRPLADPPDWVKQSMENHEWMGIRSDFAGNHVVGLGPNPHPLIGMFGSYYLGWDPWDLNFTDRVPERVPTHWSVMRPVDPARPPQ